MGFAATLSLPPPHVSLWLLLLVRWGRRVIAVLAAVRDHHWLQGPVTGVLLLALDRTEHVVQSLQHSPEHHVLAVEVRGGARCDEELPQE